MIAGVLDHGFVFALSSSSLLAAREFAECREAPNEKNVSTWKVWAAELDWFSAGSTSIPTRQKTTGKPTFFGTNESII